MLICFKYFIVYLRLYLTKVEEAKSVKSDLATSFFKGILAKEVFVWDIFIEPVSIRAAFIRNTCIGVRLFNINSWL